MRWLQGCIVAGLASVVSCGHDPPPSAAAAAGKPAGSAQSQAVGLDALAERITTLSACKDSCCTRDLPAWVFGHPMEPHDPGSLRQAREAIRSAAPPRSKALAAMRVAVEMQPDDVDLLAPLISAQDDTGTLPTLLVGQLAQACYPVSWSHFTLGQVALDSLRRMTGASFQSQEQFLVWRKERGSLEESFAYWEDSLHSAYGTRHDELARQLESRSELWLRVMLCGDSQAAGTVDPGKTGRVARDVVGSERIVRMLQGTESWRECTTPERFQVFAQRVFRLAEATKDPVLQEAMMSLWSERKFSGRDSTQAVLAVSLSRLREDQGRRVLADTLDRLTSGRAPVLEELAKRYFDLESDRLQRVMLATGPQEAEDRVAILQGAIVRGEGALPMLRKVVLTPSFAPDSAEVIGRLVAFIEALDPSASFPRKGQMHVGLYKISTPQERQGREDDSIAARKDCLERVRAWFRAGPRGNTPSRAR